MKLKLLAGTTNQGKLKEIKNILSDVDVISLSDIGLSSFEVVENLKTYQGNALKKAREIALATNMVTIADDSGLEVIALGNLPGVNSKRFAVGSKLDKVDYLLHKLKGESNRDCRFITTICLYHPGQKLARAFRASVRGQIASEKRGLAGFDYDQIFIPVNHDKTYAQLGTEYKNQISQRAKALKKLAKYIHEKFNL